MTTLIFYLILLCALLYSQKRQLARKATRDRIVEVLYTLDLVDSSLPFLFPFYDVKSEAMRCLDRIEDPKRPEKSIAYETADGRSFEARPDDAALFAFVVIGRYAVDYEKEDLRAFVDEHILSASR